MEQDEKRRKGSAVTKPIELREKKAGGPERARPEKSQISSREKKMTNPASVSMIMAGRSRKKPKPEIVDQIGQRLRIVYNSVLAQPIPERFHELLRELEAGTANRAEPPAERRSGHSKDQK